MDKKSCNMNSNSNRATAFSRVLAPSTVYGLTVLNLIVLFISLITEIAAIWDISKKNRDDNHLSHRGVTGVIILILFGLNTSAQFYFGVYLYTGVINRELDKCRAWFVSSVNLIGLELISIVFFSLIGPTLEYFTSLLMFGLMFKFVILWPVDAYITDLESCLRPLMEDHSEFHI